MRAALLLVVFSFTIILESCSWYFYAYIRNGTSKPATVDVYLLDKSEMHTLPNKIKLASRVVDFKAGYKKLFEHTENVQWLDTSHFKFEIKPHSTMDLTEMTGKFRNGSTRGNMRVIITCGNKVDTLLNGLSAEGREKFNYEHVGLTTHILYYDIYE